MTDSLFDIYLPLIGWTLAGVLLLRALPEMVPKLMGRSLYWVGVPVQVLAFMQRADLTQTVWLVPVIVVSALLAGMMMAGAICWRFPKEQHGSFLLSAVLGNTGFVGLAVAPYLVTDAYLGWVVLFSLAHNIIGSYGLGVVISSYYGDRVKQVSWLTHLKAVTVTPTLWAFGLGMWLQWQQIELLAPVNHGLQMVAKVVAPVALLLVGIRLRQMQSWQGFMAAVPAVTIKALLLPLAVGLGLTGLGIKGMPCLAMVLEAGMPTALAGVILAEEYNVAHKEIIVLSIALSSVGVLITIPLWLWLF
ncbi:AEC family transporter [Tumidithrix elongata RA019]|uniref:AEC family transporter n=1 Tax=Tumidithrix elongata BACA0141 TaxID=2716417 RepID=A0AAW9PT60_9CYAN|nr:AEC family transporter [Tumidithrix elongata RA019]